MVSPVTFALREVRARLRNAPVAALARKRGDWRIIFFTKQPDEAEDEGRR